MTVQASLAAFLKTGRIGPIHIGMKMSDVERLAGPPKWDCGNVWLYGSVDIGFTGRRHCASRVYYLQVEIPNGEGRFVGYRGLSLRDERFASAAHKDGSLDFGAFIRFTRANAIRLVRTSNIIDGDPSLFTEGGVIAAFSTNESTGEVYFSTFLTEDGRFHKAKHLPIGFARAALTSNRKAWRRLGF